MMQTLNPTVQQLKMLASIRRQFWAMREDCISEFALAALNVPEKQEADWYADYYNMREPMAIDSNGIAHVQVVGAMVCSAPRIYEKLGLATRYETIIGETEKAVDSGARGILYHINSPGGTVSGNVEASKAIIDAGKVVATAAHCTGLACSAAYKVACACQTIAAEESAEVGNIGTILSWADCSEFWRQNGIEFKALTNQGADLKSTFHLEPNATQLAFLQERLDEHGQEFKDFVKAQRPSIDEEVFRAGWYSGKKAQELGLVDGTTSAEDARQKLLERIG